MKQKQYPLGKHSLENGIKFIFKNCVHYAFAFHSSMQKHLARCLAWCTFYHGGSGIFKVATQFYELLSILPPCFIILISFPKTASTRNVLSFAFTFGNPKRAIVFVWIYFSLPWILQQRNTRFVFEHYFTHEHVYVICLNKSETLNCYFSYHLGLIWLLLVCYIRTEYVRLASSYAYAFYKRV